MIHSFQFPLCFLILITFASTSHASNSRSRIIKKRENIKYNEAIEKAKSGIFYFKVMIEDTYDGINIFRYEGNHGTGFCTVYGNKTYFITRDNSIRLITRLLRQDLIFPRFYWEDKLEKMFRAKYTYCLTREGCIKIDNKCHPAPFNHDVYIVAKSNNDDRWLKLKVENSMLHNDLAILRFEDATSVDPNSCLAFDETGDIPRNGIVRTFFLNNGHNGIVIEGSVEKVQDDDCKTYFQVSFPSIKTSIKTLGFNSGSPLLNEKGEVVGIDGQEGVNESLMGNTLARLIQHHHTRNKSGLYKIDGIDLEFKRDPSYVGISVINSTNKHFKKGDIIKICNGTEITDTKSLNQLLLFLSNDQPLFYIDCIVTRNNSDVDTRGLVKEMEPEDVIKFHKQLHCVNVPILEYDFSSLRGNNTNEYLFFGLNVDCANVLGRPLNYENPLEANIEGIRNASLKIKTILLLTFGNDTLQCKVERGSAFITKENGNFYVVSNQDVILSENDTPYKEIYSCVYDLKINNKSLINRICSDKEFKFNAELSVRAIARNHAEFILKKPLRNVNAIKMLDVVVTTFLDETSPKDFLEFADDIPRLNEDVVSIGNQQRLFQTYSMGKVTEEEKKIQKDYLGTRYTINLWKSFGNSGAAIVRAKDKKVIGLDGPGGYERTHSLSAPFLHKLVKSLDKYKKIMLFHPVGVGFEWGLERNKSEARVFKKLKKLSLNQPLKVADKIIKINNENIGNPDDVIIASTLEAKNLDRMTINNGTRYGCYVRMVVIRKGNEITLDYVPIVEMSNAELSDVENRITREHPTFDRDFTEMVKYKICSSNVKSP